jgi:RND family efflux transporter MFP subunit
MTPSLRKWISRLTLLLVVVLVVLLWLLYFHNDLIAKPLPKWGWLQKAVASLGQAVAEAPADDEDPDNAKNEIPVHTAHITTATLHRYVEGFGAIAPRPAGPGGMGGSASIASPIAGVVSKVLCEAGRPVHTGDPLIQLDDRLAKAALEQAQAALNQAEASLAALKATPRPDQLQIAQLAVEKAQSGLEFAQKNYDRVQQLAADQITPGKNLQQAAQDLAAARNDLTTAQRQLDILKNTPTPEDVRQESAKVAQAGAALSASRIQLQMLTIVSPLDATVVSVAVNPGEAVDTTKTLVQLVALDRLIVDVDLPADQLPANAQGLAAEIIPTATPASPASAPASPAGTPEPLMGKVSFVSPQVDPRTGAVQVSIDLPADTRLRPGLSVHVRIIAEEHKDVLAVPREAVVADENGDNVIALVEGEQATHKHVKIGLQESGLIEIEADGIKEGDTVVTAGAYGLPQATHVKILD